MWVLSVSDIHPLLSIWRVKQLLRAIHWIITMQIKNRE